MHQKTSLHVTNSNYGTGSWKYFNLEIYFGHSIETFFVLCIHPNQILKQTKTQPINNTLIGMTPKYDLHFSTKNR